MGDMLGALFMAIVLVFVLPALFWVAYGVVGLLLSWSLTRFAEDSHPGSELIDTNL